jgi:hypothetical protein
MNNGSISELCCGLPRDNVFAGSDDGRGLGGADISDLLVLAAHTAQRTTRDTQRGQQAMQADVPPTQRYVSRQRGEAASTAHVAEPEIHGQPRKRVENVVVNFVQGCVQPAPASNTRSSDTVNGHH